MSNLTINPLRVKDPISHGLPSAYTELEWIETSGTQYINTGIRPTQDYKMRAVFQPTAVQAKCFVGERGSSAKDMAFTINAGNSGTRMYYAFDGSDNMTISEMSTEEQTAKWDITIDKTGAVGIVLGTTYTRALESYTDFTASNSIWIGGCGGSTALNSATKFFIVEIWNNGTLVGKFIPAKRNSDSVIGMYDTVTQAFFVNAGTGDFTYGDEIPTYFELNELNKKGAHRIYKPESITKTGTPSVTTAGIYTTTSSDSYVRSSGNVPFSTASKWTFHWKFTYAAASSDQGIMSGSGGADVQAIINNSGKPRMSFGNGSSSGWYDGGIWNEATGAGTTLVSFNYVAGRTYVNEIRFTGTEYQFWVDGVEIGYCTCSSKAANTYFAVGVERGRASGQYTRCSWDLTETYLVLDDVDYLDWNILPTYEYIGELYKKNYKNGGYYDRYGAVIEDTNGWYEEEYYPIGDNKTVTITNSGTSSEPKFIEYDSNKNQLDYWSVSNATWTLKANTAYVRISYYNTSTNLTMTDGDGNVIYKQGYSHIFSAGHETEVSGLPVTTMSDSRGPLYITDITITGIEATTYYAYFPISVISNASIGDMVVIKKNNTDYYLHIMKIDSNYIYIENPEV